MVTFKSEEEFKKHMMMQCEKAVEKSVDKIYKIIKKYLDKYYAYEPDMYVRTEQLLHSLVKTNVKTSGNHISAEVYFDVSSLQYSNKVKVHLSDDKYNRVSKYLNTNEPTFSAKPDVSEIVKQAMEGGTHGGYGSAPAIWDESDIEIRNKFGSFAKLLLSELKAAGIPVK